MENKHHYMKQLGGCFVTTLFLFWIIYLYTLKTDFFITINSNVKGKFQIFWAGDGQYFHEKRSVIVPIRSGVQSLSIRIAGLGKVAQIRIDPAASPGTFTISEVRLEHAWFKPVRLISTRELKQIKPLYHIHAISYQSDAMKVTSIGNDPQLHAIIRARKSNIMYGVYLITLLFTSSLFLCKSLGFADRVWNRLDQYSWIHGYQFILELGCFLCAVGLFGVYVGKQFHYSISFIKQIFP